ncbi:ATP/GTP-binding protein [Billgrantia azerbaijanica]|nr:ATP/GTP-binding protein [Halomonas azerbaijanica]
MQRPMTVPALLSVGLVAAGIAQADERWRTAGFATPESVLHDAAHDRLIVSNMKGGPTEANGTGYLSLLSREGEVLEERWSTGLDAPKGMAIHGDRLYVADITRFHVIDLETGEVLETATLDGSAFLNDVTAHESGAIYVTDMMTHAIYRHVDGETALWLQSDELDHPNGILAQGERLIVGTWGAGMQADFTTEVPGGLLAIDIATQAITPLPQAERLGNLDGVVEVDGTFFVTDYMAGVLWRHVPGSEPERMATLQPGSADLGTDGDALFIPLMNGDEVVALDVAE